MPAALQIQIRDCRFSTPYSTKENNLYKITPNLNTLLNTEFINDEPIPKRVKLDVNKTYLWHLRLGHINQTKIERLVKDEPLKELRVTPLPTCESCLEGKMTKRSFPSKGHQANDLLELIHSDFAVHLMYKHEEIMSILSLLLMIALDMDMYT